MASGAAISSWRHTRRTYAYNIVLEVWEAAYAAQRLAKEPAIILYLDRQFLREASYLVATRYAT